MCNKGICSLKIILNSKRIMFWQTVKSYFSRENKNIFFTSEVKKKSFFSGKTIHCKYNYIIPILFGKTRSPFHSIWNFMVFYKSWNFMVNSFILTSFNHTLIYFMIQALKSKH